MQLGTTILQGRYRIIEHIGRGGMGSVYKAEDQRLHMTVALKQTLVTSEALRKAFIREAQLLASLRHPTIPRVTDHFVDENGQFLVMEYIPGDDLDTVLKRRQQPFELADVLHWADQLLTALDYLHTRNPAVVHRDIKPKNLKLTEKGDIILLDFGLAKSTLVDGSSTVADSIFGFTPHYAPLEQINGTGTDRRSDLYSLAATLYHLLTGSMPVDATSRAVALINHEPDPLLPADQLNPGVPPTVAEVLQQALAQKASERPLSAADMREALRNAASDSVSLAGRERSDDAPNESDQGSEESVYESGDATEIATKARTTIKMRRRPGSWLTLRRISAIAAVPLVLAGSFLAYVATRDGGMPQPTPVQPSAVASAVASAPAASAEAAATPSTSVAASAAPTPEAASSVAAASSAPEPPRPMSGSVNVAVADFSPAEQANCAVQPDEAHGLSMALWSTLAERVGTASDAAASAAVPLDDIEIMSPELTGALAGSTPEEQLAAAQDKARELNADVVLYGNVECESTPRRTQVLPRVYLSDRKLQSFEQLEFIGAHELGPAFSSAGTPTSGSTRAELAQTLLPRVDMLVRFLFGLDSYYAGRYEQAASTLQSAIDIQNVDTPFLQALVRLFQGTTAARLQDWEAARSFYNQVLEIEPDNVRAKYSIAEAVYYPSRGDCVSDQAAPNGPKDNVDGLRDALQQYQQIVIEDATPAGDAMRGILALGIGHTNLCLSQIGTADPAEAVSYINEAEKYFNQAIEFFDEQNSWTRDQLAEAHEGLGYTILYVPSKTAPDNPDAATNWRQAGQHFCSATQLSGYANRQAAFHHLIAYIHGRLGEYEQADVERLAAIAIDPAVEAQYASLHTGWRDEWAKNGTTNTPAWTCQATARPSQ